MADTSATIAGLIVFLLTVIEAGSLLWEKSRLAGGACIFVATIALIQIINFSIF